MTEEGERFLIRGGRRLKGTIGVQAAKNAVLPCLAASLLTAEPLIVHDVPDLQDVRTMARLLAAMGVDVRARADGAWFLRATGPVVCEAPYELVRQMRAGVVVMGPLLGRFGRARVGLPGGCAIGTRPIDLHLKGFAALGATVSVGGGYVEAEAPGGLRGARIYLDYPSVTATENIVLAAAVARGQTLVENCAMEPEVVDLANCLNAMGARVSGAGTRAIRVDGRPDLGGAEHVPIPDRVEAGTYLIAAALTRGEVEVRGVVAEHLQAVVAKLREAGADVWQEESRLLVLGPPRPRATDVMTLPYPGFPTDLQPQFTALLALSEGTGVVSETVFDNRLRHVDELKRMGAQIRIDGRSAIVTGVDALDAAPVVAPDLRAGAALVLAGLAAHGETEVTGVHHIDRGYVDLAGSLAALGADVRRVAGGHEVPLPLAGR
jgi:UDP-N-acetylglucosamine 1-carboxyvinyltransferase